MPNKKQIKRPNKQPTQTIDPQLLAQIKALSERIKARRGGKLITIDILEQVRAERDEELAK